MTVLIALSLAYLLGSIPSAWIAAHLRGIEIRDVGSGSVGATNVVRTLGTRVGVAVMLADVLKGVVAVVIARTITDDPWPLIAGGVAILGHVFPVWLTFRGGKGVAVGLGVVIGILPLAVVVLVPLWLVIVVVTRYVSLASIVGALAFPVAALALGASYPEIIFATLVAVGVIYFHRANIARLVRGEELRIALRRKASPVSS